MAIYADRVRETTVTTGTGTYALDGAVTGFRTFVAGVGSSAVVTYCCENGADWEVGEGTTTNASPDTLTRTTILASSNGGSAVNWGVGSKNIFLTAAASRTAFTDTENTFSAAQTLERLRLPHGSAPGTPSNGDMWTTTSGVYAHINGATVGPLIAAIPTMIVRYEQPSGTNGGATTTGSNNTVPYNTTHYNTISGASLISNVITSLPSGTYAFRVRQALGGQMAQLTIYNDTDATALVVCDSAHAMAGLTVAPNFAHGSGVFTIAAAKNIKVMMWVSLGSATVGFGKPVASGSTEVFGTLELYKIA